MTVDALAARMLIDNAHLAWSNRDLPALLRCYHDDIRYTCNVGPAATGLFVAVGHKAMVEFLQPVLDVAESMSVVETFSLSDDVGRATVSCFVRHNATGHILSGQYRQVIHFNDGKIARLDEVHDARRIAAFWKLIGVEAASAADENAELPLFPTGLSDV